MANLASSFFFFLVEFLPVHICMCWQMVQFVLKHQVQIPQKIEICTFLFHTLIPSKKNQQITSLKQNKISLCAF